MTHVVRHGSQLSIHCGALNLGVDGIIQLQEKFAKLPGATSMTLDLQHNDIGDAGTKLVGLALEKSTSLTSLTLQMDGNSIGDEGVRSLGVAIGKMNSLRSLSLSLRYNQIGSAGLGDLASDLKHPFG